MPETAKSRYKLTEQIQLLDTDRGNREGEEMLMLVVALAGLVSSYQAEPSTGLTENPQAPADRRIKLWNEFEAGMSPEDAAAVALTVPGVKSAKVEKARDGNGGVKLWFASGKDSVIAGKRSTFSLVFENNKLVSVEIEPQIGSFGYGDCLTHGLSGYDYYKLLLGNKYSQNIFPKDVITSLDAYTLPGRGSVRQRVYNKKMMKSGYTDGSIQITIDLQITVQNPPPRGAVNMAYTMCKDDNGVQARPLLTYWSKERFDADELKRGQVVSDKVDDLSDDL